MYNGWGSIYWDSSVGDTAAWGLYLQQVGVADQPLVDEFTTNYIVGGENLCLAPSFDNYTSEMGAISGITSPSQGSAVFNGTSDYISLGTDTIGIETSSFTISYWAYITNTSWRSVQNRGTGTFGTTIGIQLSSVAAYGMANTGIDDGAGNYIQFASATYIPNVWQYHTLTFDTTTGTAKLYFDGSLLKTEVNANLIGADFTNLNWEIGRANQNTQYLDGNLANVAIWNRALTSDEINSVMWKQYQDLNTQEINGLQAWYSLDSTEVFDWYNYAQNQGATIEGKQCVDNALNALAQL